MRWFKRIALTLVAIVVLLLGIGLILPSTFKVQRSIDVSAAPERIYSLAADPREWKKWSAWNARDPAMKIAYSGPPSGSGAKWTWESASEGKGDRLLGPDFEAGLKNLKALAERSST